MRTPRRTQEWQRMGGHHRRPDEHELGRTPRAAWLVLAPIALLTVVAMAWLWPTEDLTPPEGQGGAAQYDGTITAIESSECTEDLTDDVNGCGTATVALEVPEDDPRQNPVDEAEVPLPNGPGAPEVAEGDDVVLILNETPDGESYAIVDHQRGTGLVVLVGAFVLAMVAFGRWRGVSALAGLGVTFLLLLYFVVPAILAGSPPLLVAIVGSAAIMLTVLYLTHGLAATTTVAVLGTLASLTLTGVLSALAVSALHLTGVTDDLSLAVGMTQGVNTEGLLLAGIVIGSLGVLDDVTVTQSATVAELARANPAYGALQLFRAGSRVGRSHIASVVNTIVLAYAGSALPLLILIVANTESLGSVVTDQIIAQEVVRSVVATLGLVAAVPLTTGLAALVLRSHPDPQA
ncbi:putative membrane protein [Nocardioides marinisabuli]|uniref:Putative membrane protein n=1 Tax=Nocardioides marinisabuli TaxID=419476 RepID=A0A7Y9F126_9ACTN|nr:YibE/F family protein [Nocardioides marinisabuli]NYD57401.1 putative membrane protein [Nocardioides marinisabuli]